MELLEFAELTLQLAEAANARDRAAVLALIGPAWPNNYILVDAAETPTDDEAQPDEVRAQARVKVGSAAARDDPKWLVQIASTSLPGGTEPVPVGVNGPAVAINRNVEVEVPHRYIEALQHAVRVSVSQDPKTQEMHYTTFTNYPLEIIRRPSRAEIEAWFERTKDNVLA